MVTLKGIPQAQDSEARDGGTPFVRVVRGQPSDEETAALVVAVAVLTARARAAREPGAAPRPATWASHARALRVPAAPGAGAWRRSALPG